MNRKDLAGVPTMDLLRAASPQEPTAEACLNLSTKLIEHGNSKKNGAAYMPLVAIEGPEGREKFAYLSYQVSTTTRKLNLEERTIPVDMVRTLFEATRSRIAHTTIALVTESNLGGLSHYIRTGDYGIPHGEPKKNELLLTPENIEIVVQRIIDNKSIKDLIAAQKASPTGFEPSAP